MARPSWFRGVIAREQQASDHGPELPLAQPVAVLRRLDQAGDHVVTGARPAILDEFVDVRAELIRRLLHLGEPGTQLERQQIGQRLTPLGEQRMVFAGHAEHLTNHLDRVLVGEVGHELAVTVAREVVEQLVDEGSHHGAMPIRGPWRERAGDETPQARVVRPVHGDHRVAEHPRQWTVSPALKPDEVRHRGHQPWVGQQVLHLPASQHTGAQWRADHRGPRSQLVHDRLGIRLHGRVDSVEDVPGDGVQVSLDFTVEVEGSAKPACVARALYRYYPQ